MTTSLISFEFLFFLSRLLRGEIHRSIRFRTLLFFSFQNKFLVLVRQIDSSREGKVFTKNGISPQQSTACDGNPSVQGELIPSLLPLLHQGQGHFRPIETTAARYIHNYDEKILNPLLAESGQKDAAKSR